MCRGQPPAALWSFCSVGPRQGDTDKSFAGGCRKQEVMDCRWQKVRGTWLRQEGEEWLCQHGAVSSQGTCCERGRERAGEQANPVWQVCGRGQTGTCS